MRHVAVAQWSTTDELANAIRDELQQLGYFAKVFHHLGPIPDGMDVIFSFAPYGPFLPLARKVAESRAKPPLFVHWNTEGIPDLRIPWSYVGRVSSIRSKYERALRKRGMQNIPPFSTTIRQMVRYRYVGDYHYAYRRNWLHVFADSSAIYAQIRNQHGLPTVYAPWGATRTWYDDLALERDIDVLWMGKYGSKRRRTILRKVRDKLVRHGKNIYLADNENSPFIFGRERTQYLNRSKIVINVTRTWYDDNFSRFALAAPNRALIVSEPMLPHCPAYEPETHYVSASIEDLAATILNFLENDYEREQITERAYRLVTEEIPFTRSIGIIMRAVEKKLSSCETIETGGDIRFL